VARDAPYGFLVAEGVAEDDVVGVLLGHLAHDALHVAGVADVVDELVGDKASGFGVQQRRVYDTVPRLLDRRGVHRVHAHDVLSSGHGHEGRNNDDYPGYQSLHQPLPSRRALDAPALPWRVSIASAARALLGLGPGRCEGSGLGTSGGRA